MQLNSEANELSYYDQCNIGMAVDGKGATQREGCRGLTLFEIAKEVGRLTNAAREGRVEQADLKGGTISIPYWCPRGHHGADY